jgi:hypothetical protein
MTLYVYIVKLFNNSMPLEILSTNNPEVWRSVSLYVSKVSVWIEAIKTKYLL